MEAVRFVPLLLWACVAPTAPHEPAHVALRTDCHGQHCYIVSLVPGLHKQIWTGTAEWERNGLRFQWEHGDTLMATDSAYANWDFTFSADADYFLIVTADGGQASTTFHSTRDSTWAP